MFNHANFSSLIFIVAMFCSPFFDARVDADVIEVDATLYKKHQVCLADVRGISGHIERLQLVPSVDRPEDLQDLKVLWFWDGGTTPFIVCSLGELFDLLEPDGSPRKALPILSFSEGFRIFIECPRGRGGRVTGQIVYEESGPPATSKRLRYDPGLEITTPQLSETVRTSSPDMRIGRGETIAIPNAGFESGRLSPWYDLSWDSAESEDAFKVYSSGTEGVRAYDGRFMAGIVRGGNTRALARVPGLVPGYRYRLSAAVNTWGLDKDGWIDKAKTRVGISTAGSYLMTLHPEQGDLWTIDFSHPKFYYPHCWGGRLFAHSHDHWSRIAVSTRAEGEVASLYLHGTQLLPSVRKWCLFDDVRLENIPVPMGAIAGRVTDENGKGVHNQILITEPYGFAAQTRKDGHFDIEDVPEGEYAVRVQGAGQRVAAEWVRVLADRTGRLEIVLGDSPAARAVVQESQADENQLINAGFESGDLAGWHRAYDSPAMDVARATRRVAPQSGEFMFGGEHVYHHAGAREILYQRVPVAKGSRWTLQARLFAHSVREDDDRSSCRLVADPSGGTAFTVSSEKHTGVWEDVSISFVAQVDTVTVGVAMEQAPRSETGLSSDLGIVDHLPRAESRMDYEAYYCDVLRLVPASEDAVMAGAREPEPQQRVTANRPPVLPEAETATITLPDGETTMDLIRIPAGRFLMGADNTTGWAGDDEFPRHHVTLDAYWIGKYEVTNAQYKAFCDATGYAYPPDPAFSEVPWMHRDRRYHYGDYFTAMPDYPVVNVTWHDARAFCRWAGLRLPTEAEWEMAARGPGDTLRTYPWGEQTNPAWTTRTRDNTSIQVMPDWYLYTCPVDRFERPERFHMIGESAMGLYGMGGNVREWCADWYGPYTAQAKRNPTGPESGTEKVLRGGCWRGRDYGVQTRSSYRHQHDPKYFEWGTTGFRVTAGTN